MKRTIEKLTAKRQKKETALLTKLQGLKEKSQKHFNAKNTQTFRQTLAELEKSIKINKKKNIKSNSISRFLTFSKDSYLNWRKIRIRPESFLLLWQK